MRLLPLAFSVCVGIALSGSAAAATITVDSTSDAVATDGFCTLREAVIAANTDAAADVCAAGSGADEIVVPAGTYAFSLGTIAITSELVISGAGAGATIFDGTANGTVALFDVTSAVAFTVQDVEATNISGPPSGNGGFVHTNSGATVAVTRCYVHDNDGRNGVGLMMNSGAGGGTGFVIDSVFENNAGQFGGAISIYGSEL